MKRKVWLVGFWNKHPVIVVLVASLYGTSHNQLLTLNLYILNLLTRFVSFEVQQFCLQMMLRPVFKMHYLNPLYHINQTFEQNCPWIWFTFVVPHGISSREMIGRDNMWALLSLKKLLETFNVTRLDIRVKCSWETVIERPEKEQACSVSQAQIGSPKRKRATSSSQTVKLE